MRRAAAAFAFSAWAFLASAGVALAQAQEEIVVTASRYEEEYEDFKVPHVSLLRRADAIVTVLRVSSDTRDFAARTREIREALREMERRVRGSGVSLAFERDDVVRPFTAAGAEEAITSGDRPDTSQVSFSLRTAISPSDTIDTAMGRLEAFRDGLPRNGRIEYFLKSVPDLTLINPSQYRMPVIATISADVQAVTRSLGPGYAARIEGLEQQIAWRRTGDLELTLFIPYRLEIRPVATEN